MSEDVVATLPTWIKMDKEKPWIANVDPDGFYPFFLERLGFGEVVTQYTLEVCYQCMKLETQFRLSMTDQDPRPSKSLVINVCGSNDHKERWAQAGKDPGRKQVIINDIMSAARAREEVLTPQQVTRLVDLQIGREARNIYKSWRGFVPQ